MSTENLGILREDGLLSRSRRDNEREKLRLVLDIEREIKDQGGDDHE